MSSVSGPGPAVVSATPVLVLSSGGTGTVWLLATEGDVDGGGVDPRGWARAGTRWANRLVRVDGSAAGPATADCEGDDDASWGAEAEAEEELCSRDRRWVWV